MKSEREPTKAALHIKLSPPFPPLLSGTKNELEKAEKENRDRGTKGGAEKRKK